MQEPSYPTAERIKEWARRDGDEIREADLSEITVAWGLIIRDDTAVPLQVYAQPSDPSAIALQINLGATPGQLARLDKMRGSREEFFYGLRSLLVKHHVAFQIFPKGVLVGRKIYADGLTQDRFWRDVTAVRCAAFDVTLYYNQHLGGGESPDLLGMSMKPN